MSSVTFSNFFYLFDVILSILLILGWVLVYCKLLYNSQLNWKHLEKNKGKDSIGGMRFKLE